jgi:asparagine synthetase B (glutamine-hydrolysing)
MPLELPSSDPQPLPPGDRRTDVFHRQPLFSVAGCVVRSWNEAHALHGPASPADVNPAYVAALISGDHRADVAPYRRIRRLPRAHQVRIAKDGSVQSHAYDALAQGAGPMAAEALYEFLRQGLLEHLQWALADHPGPIGCEHSSGLDSNAVLGALVHGLRLPPERLHTWSNEGSGEGEPLQRIRPFHGLKAEQCHLSPEAAQHHSAGNHLALHLRVLGAPAQVGGMPLVVDVLAAQGCTLLFSGFGGDQAISHNAANVPTDLVAQGRWRELVRWCGGRREALKTGAGRALALSCRPWAERKVLRRTREFVHSDILERRLTPAGRAWLGPHFRRSYPWEIDGYLRQHSSIRRRVLADWVAVRAEGETRLAAARGLAKAFPLLDERLIATLLQQDPALFGEGAGRGRLLHRRAFAPFLPPELRVNPSKDREPPGGLDAWRAELLARRRQALECQLQGLNTLHPALAHWWDLATIRQETEAILASAHPMRKEVLGTILALTTLHTLSGWWQALEG